MTATEFHDVLHAGTLTRGDPPERVAAAILGLVRSGEPEAVLTPPGFGR